MGWISCQCTGLNECMVCCDTGSGNCVPVDENTTLADGVPCESGVCKDVSVLIHINPYVHV